MRVKLQYTVDVHDIPRELEWMSDRLKKDMDEVFDIYKQLDFDSMDKSTKNIEQLRTAMFDADTKLQDIYGIISGYLAYISQAAGLPANQEQSEDNNVKQG